MVFNRESALRRALEIALGSKRGIAERDSLKSSDFLIIFRRENILFSCLACIAAMATSTKFKLRSGCLGKLRGALGPPSVNINS